LQQLLVDALLFRGGDVQREQPGRRRVDRHRRVHLVQGQTFEQRAHVAEMRDRDADLADLTQRERMIGVVARLCGQIERDREARLALGEVVPVELVGSGRGAVPRVSAHDPRALF
jgi:hypothetical protein